MTCIYNKELFMKFRDLAVTDIKDIKIGGEYFSNDGAEFTVLEIITSRQEYKRMGIEYSGFDPDELEWIVTRDRTYSLKDKNVGASHNPWLIFENKHLADACKEMMPVQIEIDQDDCFLWDE